MKLSFGTFSLKRYIFSFILSFLITVCTAGILGILLSLFCPPQWLINTIDIGIFYFSATLAAFFSTLHSEKNGLIKGAMCAVTYGGILVLSGIIFLENSFDGALLFKSLLITAILGAIAGIIGINFKKRR